jgi:predicted glycogen debranching enzyme
MVANQPTRLLSDQHMDFLSARYPVLDTFTAAASTFVKHVDNTIQIWAASRDWFLEEWGRDTFISLPGILLAPSRYSEAQAIIDRFARLINHGLIPNRIRDSQVEYNTVDASMWFIQAIKAYLRYTQDWVFVRTLLPVIRNIITSYKNGTSFFRWGESQIIQMDEDDGLIRSPPQATWMDADPTGMGKPITPRYGKPVEINSLWYSNLRFLSTIEQHFNTGQSSIYEDLADTVRNHFDKKFWNNRENALYDVIEGDPHKCAIRPNMIFAVSHGDDLLPHTHQISVVYTVLNDLVTPGGLRSLSPRDSNYRGNYDTYLPPEEKDLVYHQGTVWPWLIGPYVDAMTRILKYQRKTRRQVYNEINRIISPLVRFCMESPYQSLPEVYSGDPPHYPGGTTAQAWSVAEVLRVLIEHQMVNQKNDK